MSPDKSEKTTTKKDNVVDIKKKKGPLHHVHLWPLPHLPRQTWIIGVSEETRYKARNNSYVVPLNID